MALAVAVFALAVMGGLVAGNFVAGLLEQQSAHNTLFGMQAAEAAEAELRAALELVPATSLSAIPVGGTPTLLDSVAFNGVAVERQVSRLTDRVFLVRTRASRIDGDGNALATRSLGLLITLTVDAAGQAAGVAPLAQRSWIQLY
jgi:hypothetical protein